MTLIDLGDVTDGAEPALTRHRPPPVGRPLRALLVGLLALLGLAAAAPPPTRPVLLFTRDTSESGSYLSEDLIVVLESTGGGSLPVRTLVGLELADGRTRWRWTPSGDGQFAGLDRWGDGLLVSTGDEGDVSTVLLDPADGRVRWRQPGVARATGDGGVVLETVTPESVTVRGVDGATGAVRWTTTTGAGTVLYRQVDDTTTAVVVVTRDGRAEVRDPSTGALRTALRVPVADGDLRETASVAGDLLLVADARDRWAAYDLDTGDRRWQAAVNRAEQPFAGPCADVICLYGLGGVRVLDPSTGRPRWSADGDWLPLFRLDGRLVGVRVNENGERLALLDPATGRVAVDLTGWQLVGAPSVDAALRLVRPVSDGRLLLGDLAADGSIRPGGLLPGPGGRCYGRSTVLSCEEPSGRLRVWRLPG